MLRHLELRHTFTITDQLAALVCIVAVDADCLTLRRLHLVATAGQAAFPGALPIRSIEKDLLAKALEQIESEATFVLTAVGPSVSALTIHDVFTIFTRIDLTVRISIGAFAVLETILELSFVDSTTGENCPGKSYSFLLIKPSLGEFSIFCNVHIDTKDSDLG